MVLPGNVLHSYPAVEDAEAYYLYVAFSIFHSGIVQRSHSGFRFRFWFGRGVTHAAQERKRSLTLMYAVIDRESDYNDEYDTGLYVCILYTFSYFFHI